MNRIIHRSFTGNDLSSVGVGAVGAEPSTKARNYAIVAGVIGGVAALVTFPVSPVIGSVMLAGGIGLAGGMYYGSKLEADA